MIDLTTRLWDILGSMSLSAYLYSFKHFTISCLVDLVGFLALNNSEIIEATCKCSTCRKNKYC